MFFWQHCLFVATLSKSIAEAIGYRDPDALYTAGLLHDIGKIVLEAHGHVTYSDFLDAHTDGGDYTLEDERNFFGINHAQIGGQLCEDWGLPPLIAAVAACHHGDSVQVNRYRSFQQEIAIVSCANFIAWMQGIGSVNLGSHSVMPTVWTSTLDIRLLDLEALLLNVDEEMRKIRTFYGIDFPAITKLRSTLVETAFKLQQSTAGSFQQSDGSTTLGSMTHCLTAPHRSLEPDDFVPFTLAAIQQEFGFKRLIQFSLDPQKRSFTATYWQPHDLSLPQSLELSISNSAGTLLQCLRGKQPGIAAGSKDRLLLELLDASTVILLPIFHQDRLLGLITADYATSQHSMSPDLPSALAPIANELGTALANANRFRQEKFRAQTDPLTGLFNKGMIQRELMALYDGPVGTRKETAIGLIDIDRFKSINDNFGHQAGDDVLRIIADVLQKNTRPEDFVGRYGGEEFFFLLRGSGTQGAICYAERLRKEIEKKGVILAPRFQGHIITASFGLACFDPHFTNFKDQVEAADKALYQAKNSGRNKVICHEISDDSRLTESD